jgi:hypothetical protein
VGGAASRRPARRVAVQRRGTPKDPGQRAKTALVRALPYSTQPALAPPMSHSDPRQRICEAVQQCVERCKSAESPLATIGEFIGDLRSDPTWREAEITSVQMMVARYLARLHRGDD